MVLAVLILVSIVLVIIIYKAIKPYFLRYDKDCMLVGPPGSGKTYIGTKEGIKRLRVARFWWAWENKIKLKVKNHFIKKHNRKEEKHFKKNNNYITHLKELLQPIPKPQLYTWHPVWYKPHWWSSKKKREWSCRLKISYLLLLEEMTQNNVVIMDELPQAINQYNWDLDIIQANFNEYASLHRHYYNNTNIITAQAPAEIVVQIRRKMNKCTLMMYFRKVRILPLIKVQCCDIMTNELISTTTTSQFDENTKTMWQLALPKHTYDSRCYSERIKNILKPLKRGTPIERHDNLKTNEIVEFDNSKVSPLDDKTTQQQKETMWNRYRYYLGTNPSKPKGTQEILDNIIQQETNEFTEEEKRKVIENDQK